jgi:hypothetical protein
MDDTNHTDDPAPVDDVVPEHRVTEHVRRDDTQPGQEPPVSPDELKDYREFRAFQDAREAELAAETPALPTSLVLEVDGKDQTYRLCDLDRDVVVHLQALVTFAETDTERAISLFDALLEPDEFDRLKKDLRPALRAVKKAHMADPEAPTVEDVWRGMAEAVAGPIRELMSDPKRLASLGGRSPTGVSSTTDSPRSALPSMS